MYKLNQIKYLYDALLRDDILTKYEDTKKSIVFFLKEQSSKIQENLKKSLKLENTLSQQDLDEFIKGIVNLSQADELNRMHLEN